MPPGTAFRVLADGSSGDRRGRPRQGPHLPADRASSASARRARARSTATGSASATAATSQRGRAARPAPRASGAPHGARSPSRRRSRVPEGTAVTIEATVTAGATLLDSSGRRIVVQDATGGDRGAAAERRDGASGRHPRSRVTGVIGRAWGAPATGRVQRRGARRRRGRSPGDARAGAGRAR